MTRRPVVLILLTAAAGFLAFDLARSAPLDPYLAPALFALGSGQAAGGAHCAALPAR
ncbi:MULTISPECIES: hypothetical protein [Rhodovulum]|uniref:Uncharacterized protein n=1 Tax=Rhodovulum visakhapatnamense TaxID=364297 RepID=A0ABS1RMX3_9RHOB|nr:MULTISPECIES: hypothetical protein [Rhodovulum]MBL3570414.1 hypothetical protein [Rhodovulum visakhapatnamense]MBL3580242.1 hypothetical protein [Rhodovulum visakhapatnamense]